jgi:hypothetical protein
MPPLAFQERSFQVRNEIHADLGLALPPSPLQSESLIPDFPMNARGSLQCNQSVGTSETVSRQKNVRAFLHRVLIRESVIFCL